MHDCGGFRGVWLILKRLNLPTVPIILGMVLGGIMEVKLRASMGRIDSLLDFVNRPIAALLVLAIIVIVAQSIRTSIRDLRVRHEESSKPHQNKA